jgi:ankyrin repeat protein
MTLLLDRGARTDIGCNLGQTPLMYAAKTSHDTAIRVLLDRGADVDAVDDGGRTALMLVANGDDPRIARTICEFMRQRDPVGWRSSLEVRDRQGFTALIHAASEGSASMLIELIDQGARLDAEDTHGWRAIHHAMTRGCAFRNFEAMGILLNRGESPYGQFPDGQTYDSVIDVPEGRSVLMAAKVARVVDEVISKAIDHGDGTSFEDTSGILAEVTQRPWRPKRSLP